MKTVLSLLSSGSQKYLVSCGRYNSFYLTPCITPAKNENKTPFAFFPLLNLHILLAWFENVGKLSIGLA